MFWRLGEKWNLVPDVNESNGIRHHHGAGCHGAGAIVHLRILFGLLSGIEFHPGGNLEPLATLDLLVYDRVHHSTLVRDRPLYLGGAVTTLSVTNVNIVFSGQGSQSLVAIPWR